tara:strand:+ start:615 stop:1037 length:423 start_codon:yes stop_codon:yes gene_type:complete
MVNALKELENCVLFPYRDIKCATIDIILRANMAKRYEDVCISADLPVGYTEEDMDNFMKKLDIEYNRNSPHQELFGVIWLKDGTWLSRYGSTGCLWDLQECPDIPDCLTSPFGYNPQKNREELMEEIGCTEKTRWRGWRG